MRFVVFGAGAVGCVVGGRLTQHGLDVVLIGRAEQCGAVRESGLRIESSEGIEAVDVPIVEHPAEIQWGPADVVLLTMKTQDTTLALDDLAAVAPPGVPLVCMQNGVENERIALRRFPRVYGVCVMCPAAYLTPGVVQAWSSPTTGILDIGRYPAGVDDLCESIATAFRTPALYSEPRPDIMRWKYSKLLMNLGNSAGAICGPAVRSGPIVAAARREGIACFRTAGIDYVSEAEEAARRSDLIRSGPIPGRERGGGSSWQSLKRQKHSIETDYLNGEITLLGRVHGVPTPVNDLLQRLAARMAREGKPPGSMPVEEVMALLPSGCV
jgi:2-dehydropantoate 2-reductase